MTQTLPSREALLHHWQDEADAAYLYRVLAEGEPDARRKDVFERLYQYKRRNGMPTWEEALEALLPGAQSKCPPLPGRKWGKSVS